MTNKTTVETTVAAPVEQVWRAWNTPDDIKQWNAASDDWHTTKSAVDLRPGGAFSSRMEAKDGSMGFDFAGTYTKVVEHQLVESAFGGRVLVVEFIAGKHGVTVRETFDAESTHPVEQQRGGWQAILNNFKKHVESHHQPDRTSATQSARGTAWLLAPQKTLGERIGTMSEIIPHLWFDKDAKKASELYTSVFKNSGIASTAALHDTPSGTVDLVAIEIAGQQFRLLNAGPLFKFTPAISFLVACSTKDEVDAVWGPLSEGGTPLMALGEYLFSERYGWTQDRFGLSWQVMFVGDREIRQKITPTLMFVGDQCGKAEEAITFYVSLFPDAAAGHIVRYGAKEPPDVEGTVRHAGFTLNGQQFAAMDSARVHGFGFNEAISFIVRCDTQEELDGYWAKLSVAPAAEQCGWLKDKYGLSWQVVPAMMDEMHSDKDPARLARVTQAFLKMKKFDIAKLKQAYAGDRSAA